jgi:phospholipid/cholesterol/gamma-HCH transport system ATP-binding protein
MTMVQNEKNRASLAQAETEEKTVPATVELRDLRKKLGGVVVLDGISLQVRRGETMCIIGGSGAGKSVTLKHIVGLMKPDSGDVLLDGVNLTEATGKNLEELRKRIGFCFQGAALLNSLTVFENVALPLRELEGLDGTELSDRVMARLELVGLENAAQKMPSHLSGGMRKRVGLARAIIRDPEIILYDEPTSGLDPVTAATINTGILEMQEKLNVTSMLVSHDMSSAFRVSNRIAMLYKGKIIAVGTPDELKKNDDARVQQFIYGDSEGPLSREKS